MTRGGSGETERARNGYRRVPDVTRSGVRRSREWLKHGTIEDVSRGLAGLAGDTETTDGPGE